MNRGLARPRFGVRRPSGALAERSQSGRGLRQFKTWRLMERCAIGREWWELASKPSRAMLASAFLK